jgi:hypothetical protein
MPQGPRLLDQGKGKHRPNVKPLSENLHEIDQNTRRSARVNRRRPRFLLRNGIPVQPSPPPSSSPASYSSPPRLPLGWMHGRRARDGLMNVVSPQALANRLDRPIGQHQDEQMVIGTSDLRIEDRTQVQFALQAAGYRLKVRQQKTARLARAFLRLHFRDQPTSYNTAWNIYS